MQQAIASLIIEHGSLAPGILRVLTENDETKLYDVSIRLENLSATVGLLVTAAQAEEYDPEIKVKRLESCLRHIGDSLDDLVTLAAWPAKRAPVGSAA